MRTRGSPTVSSSVPHQGKFTLEEHRRKDSLQYLQAEGSVSRLEQPKDTYLGPLPNSKVASHVYRVPLKPLVVRLFSTGLAVRDLHWVQLLLPGPTHVTHRKWHGMQVLALA